MTETDQSVDDSSAITRRIHSFDETPVDLDLVDLEIAQVIEAGVAGSEIIQRDPNAQRMQGSERLLSRLKILNERALGDLEFQSLRRKAGPLERARDPRVEIRSDGL
jgi:hypothetical protein